jgi:hypothetical protein
MNAYCKLQIANCRSQIGGLAMPCVSIGNLHFAICILQWIFLALLAATPLRAQSPLPVVDDAEFAPLQAHCRGVLTAAEKKKLLPPKAVEALRRLLMADAQIADGASQVQKLLDPYCLVGVSINPESRVKAARGPAAAELRRGEEAFMLVKVHNDAGVTNGLKVSGAQIRSKEAKDGWLEAAVVAPEPLKKTLGGAKVEYVILRLRAHEAGKREATLKFDVGQGTQDLGFRAEVPILFTIKE